MHSHTYFHGDKFGDALCLIVQDEEFVRLLEKGVVPRTHNVRGSNYCLMNVFPDRITGRAIIISVVCGNSSTLGLHFIFLSNIPEIIFAKLSKHFCRLIIS